jgi:hypothetical protein
VREKEERKRREQKEQNAYDALAAEHGRLLVEVERERQRVKASAAEEYALYRQQQEKLAMQRKRDARAQVCASH